MQLVFIGGGNMAEAIFARLAGLQSDIIVIQRNSLKRSSLAAKYKFIRFLPALNFVPGVEDIVILAVKPQDAKELCNSLPKLESTIISVMAGITIHTLAHWLDTNKIVRIMSNTPASVGTAVNGMYFSDKVPAEHKQLINTIFKNIGKNYIFDDEDFIDKITAVVASSPAYIFYIIEAMIDSAVSQFGFSETDAREITLQVLKGSFRIIENNQDTSIAQLRINVTSKKGTTEAAINVFDAANLKQIITNAEAACYKRALELGTDISKD